MQADDLREVDTVLVCLITTFSRDAAAFRVPVEANPENGLLELSHIMTDKIYAIRRNRVGKVISRLDPEATALLDARLAFVLGLADS